MSMFSLIILFSVKEATEYANHAVIVGGKGT